MQNRVTHGVSHGPLQKGKSELVIPVATSGSPRAARLRRISLRTDFPGVTTQADQNHGCDPENDPGLTQPADDATHQKAALDVTLIKLVTRAHAVGLHEWNWEWVGVKHRVVRDRSVLAGRTSSEAWRETLIEVLVFGISHGVEWFVAAVGQRDFGPVAPPDAGRWEQGQVAERKLTRIPGHESFAGNHLWRGQSPDTVVDDAYSRVSSKYVESLRPGHVGRL